MFYPLGVLQGEIIFENDKYALLRLDPHEMLSVGTVQTFIAGSSIYQESLFSLQDQWGIKRPDLCLLQRDGGRLEDGDVLSYEDTKEIVDNIDDQNIKKTISSMAYSSMSRYYRELLVGHKNTTTGLYELFYKNQLISYEFIALSNTKFELRIEDDNNELGSAASDSTIAIGNHTELFIYDAHDPQLNDHFQHLRHRAHRFGFKYSVISCCNEAHKAYFPCPYENLTFFSLKNRFAEHLSRPDVTNNLKGMLDGLSPTQSKLKLEDGDKFFLRITTKEHFLPNVNYLDPVELLYNSEHLQIDKELSNTESTDVFLTYKTVPPKKKKFSVWLNAFLQNPKPRRSTVVLGPDVMSMIQTSLESVAS